MEKKKYIKPTTTAYELECSGAMMLGASITDPDNGSGEIIPGENQDATPSTWGESDNSLWEDEKEK